MSEEVGPGFSIIESVLHPTDFSESSLVAFHHALKAAMATRSRLTLLHVSTEKDLRWSNFPGVRETLENWGVLPKGSPKSAVSRLGIEVSKIVANESDPVQAVLRYLEKSPADLIVLATSQRGTRTAWLGKSVSAPVTRKAGQMTLLIPREAKGFVSGQDASVKLNNILIPVALTPRPEPALRAAARFIRKFDSSEGTFTVLHVGESNTMPALRFPEVSGWTWKKQVRGGDVIDGIVNTAKELEADLVVMATDGRNGFLDGLRGSHSERVLRQSATPLLTVPIGSRASRFLT